MAADFLSTLDTADRNRAVDAITNALEISFKQDNARQTQNEIKHRFNICLGYVGAMRKDLGWSWQRIHDTLPEALRCKLDGADWIPSARNAWVRDDNSGLILPR